jgi:HAD superfamily hydrolase (TIGR01450 family)
VSLAGAYDLVIFDLDGVVYIGTEAVPGAAEAIQSLVAHGTAVAYATNNASRRVSEVAALLGSLGVPARDDEVMTSGRASALFLAGELPSASRVLPVGAPALAEEFAAVGLIPVCTAQDKPVAVVQGYGPQVGWPRLAEACVAIRAGARWVATNTDATMPSSRGPVPGNGSLVAAVSTALGGARPHTVIGKPEPVLLTTAAHERAAQRPLVVGDRLDTDIEGARRAGMDSLLVLTGVTTPAELLAAPPHQRPTHVAAGIAALHSPDGASRVPAWGDGVVACGSWRVTVDGDAVVLDGAGGDPVDALRALSRAAWHCAAWTAIRPVSPDAAAAMRALGLDAGAR